MIRLVERTWPEAKKLARDPRAVVLLPLGAIEERGPHLPRLVHWLGSEVAPHLRRAGYRPVLAPAIPHGVSALAADWSGTVSLSAGTLRRLIVEVVGGRGSGTRSRIIRWAFAGRGAPCRAPYTMGPASQTR